MTHFVFDGSNHDWTRGAMNVAAMAADGIEGGWHKFADGLNYYVDPYFPEAARRMRASGFKFWGAYHVLWGNRDPAAQADWQIALLDQQVPGWRTDPRFRMVSDDEPFSYNVAPSIAQINAYHDRWAARVPGVVQLAYAPRWHYGSSVSGIRYPVISSNYGSNPAVHYPAGYPGDGSGRWADDVLQYGSLLVQGTQTTTDCNAVKDDALWALLVGEDVDFTNQDPNAWTQALRTEAMAHLRSKTQSGEDVPLAVVINDIQTKVTGLSVPAPAPVDPATLKAVLLDPEVLAGLAKAVNDDAAARLAH